MIIMISTLPEAWDLVEVSSDIVVAVIDDGVDLGHPDLNLVKGFDPDGSTGGGARGSHGTAVAGNVGAIKDNNKGVVGTAPGVKIMPVFSGGTTSNMANAIDVAVANGANVLSNSWGWVGVPSTDIENAIVDAIDKGVTVVFAAANGPDRPPFTYQVAFPASLNATTDVIAVGASSPTDEHKSASSSDGSTFWGSSYVGEGPDVVAPSPWSYSTDRSGNAGYNDGSAIDPSDPDSKDYTPTFGGTSSSTPKVSGIVALILSANPGLTPKQVKEILRNSADDIDAPGIDDKTGAGRVNAEKAVQMAQIPPNGSGCKSKVIVNPYDRSKDSYPYQIPPCFKEEPMANFPPPSCNEVPIFLDLPGGSSSGEIPSTDPRYKLKICPGDCPGGPLGLCPATTLLGKDLAGVEIHYLVEKTASGALVFHNPNNIRLQSKGPIQNFFYTMGFPKVSVPQQEEENLLFSQSNKN